MQKEKNLNSAAILIGFFLIVLIAAITIIRPYFSKKTEPVVITPSTDTKKSPPKSPSQLDSEELLNKITSGSNIILIDTRSEEAFTQEHIADSKNIVLTNIETALRTLDKNKTYVIIDDGSQSSLTVALDLFPQNGLKNTFYLDGGFPAWKSNNNPTISAGDPGSFSDQAKVSYLNSDGLKNLMASEKNLLIVDLRSRENYAKDHIPGAINISLDDLEAQRDKLSLGKKIILYDKDGVWAFQGAVRLFDMGTFNVFSLSDGLDAWRQKNYPLEK